MSEIIGTFVLVFVVSRSAPTAPRPASPPSAPCPSPSSCGRSACRSAAPPGYAINPARDLGPRIIHAILPIPGKGDSDWSYSWVPVVGPLIGGVLAALVYSAVWVNTMGM